jgi:uncharacterized protein YcaQ
MQQQGLLQKSSLNKAIENIAYVQIDSISVVERAHEHVLFNRVEGYKSEMLQHAVVNKQVFEYWTHAAAYLPIRDYRYSLFRKQHYLNGESHYHTVSQSDLNKVKERIKIDGPLKAKQFEHSKHKASTGWWDWKPAKKALEQLFMQGEVMALRRDKFQKVYDLTERVLPSGVDTNVPSETEFANYLIQRFIAAHGFASAKQIAYLRKGCKAPVQKALNELHEAKQLNYFKWGDEQYYYDESLTPPTSVPNKVYLLNPFDNLVIQRQRLRQCFDFEYQIEVYVPQVKRKFGYYSLPILYKDRFVGRVDVKADRQQNILCLQYLSIEEDSLVKMNCDESEKFLEAFLIAIDEYMVFNKCHSVVLKMCNHARIYKHLTGYFKGRLLSD